MATRSAKIGFPLGGVSRKNRYAQKTQPYTTPRAINVRVNGSLESRARGGSRPGLTKLIDNDFGTNITAVHSLTYLDASGNYQHDLAVICDGYLNIVQGESVETTKAYLVDSDGDKIVDTDGDYIIFKSTVSVTNPMGDASAFSIDEKNGKLYIADSSLRKYDPVTGVVSVVPNAPTGEHLVCIYQGRVVLAGKNHLFYMSAMEDEEDWDFVADMGNVTRATAGHIGNGRELGEVINSLVPFDDKVLIVGCTDSLWAIYGNITGGGRISNISQYIGVISRKALAITPDGLVLFMSRRGLYAWGVGSNKEPERFSPNRIPEELLEIDTTTTDVILEYDHRSKGVHLFLTPASGIGTHWWIDLENKGFWEVSLPETQQPVAVCTYKTSGDSNVILGCKDGYLRRFSNSATTDDGTNIQSDILLGPFHVSRMEGADGMIDEIVGAMAASGASLTWRVVVGDSAETVVDLAGNTLDGNISLASGVDASGTWVAGQNYVVKPRSRGAWAILWLSATSRWAYEAVSLWMKKLGRLR